MGIGIVGLKLQRLLQATPRLVTLASSQQKRGQIMPCQRIPGLRAQRFAHVGLGFGPALVFLKYGAEIQVSVVMLWIQPERLLVATLRLRIARERQIDI